MMKRFFASALALLTCAAIALVGCESLNGPDSAEDESLSLIESFDVTTLDGQTSLLKAAGVNTDSANAFFVLRWSEGLGHFRNSDTLKGHASAVAYEEPATLRDRNAVGLDMGTVSVLSGQSTFDLPKIVSNSFGVRYGMFGDPGGRGPHSGPRGPRGGHGGPGGGRGETIVNIPFVGGGSYQFNVSGSDKVAAMKLDIKAPSQLVQITGRADKDTIDATQDLTITWSGDAAANNMVLVLAPAMKRKPFGGGQPVAPIFQRVEAAAGSYTIAARTLQDLLSASNAQALNLHLAQSLVNESTDTQIGKILVSAGSDDRILLTIK
jgi:hypothetical protein